MQEVDLRMLNAIEVAKCLIGILVTMIFWRLLVVLKELLVVLKKIEGKL